MLSALLGHLIDSLNRKLKIRSIIEIMLWLGIADLWSGNAATVHLSILGSWRSMHLNKNLDIVLLAPLEHLINIRLILSRGHSLQVSKSLLDVLRGVRRDILAEVDPVPVAGGYSQEFDAPGLHFLEVLLLNFIIKIF